MTSPIPLFDLAMLRRRLLRARRTGYAGFLLERALEDLEDRLSAVLRRFPRALDLTSPTPIVSQRLRAGGAVDEVVRLSLLPETGNVPLVVGDPEALPFGGTPAFDLAVSLLALHAVNDLPGALVQVRRALRPDGLFLGCLLGGATLSELRQTFWQAESEIEGGVSPRVAPFAEVRELGGLLQRAGFALPVADSESLTVRYADLFALMRDLRAMGLTNALTERRRTPLRRATLMRAAAIYAERFSDADGRVRATFEIIWLLGWAPHESQQKPLRPGSAKARLADALGTTEHVLEPEDTTASRGTRPMKQPGPDHPITITPHTGTVRVTIGGEVVAETRGALSLQEASYDPVLYIPRADARWELFSKNARTTHCPYKGDASYYDVGVEGGRREAVVWSYEDPFPAVAAIKDHLAFYKDKVDAIDEVKD